MCATVLAPEVTMTTPVVGTARYQVSNFRPMEQTRDRQRQLGTKWVAVTDERGNRRLQMRWTLARFFLSPPVCEATRPGVEAAVGRGHEPTPGLQARLLVL